MQSIIIHLDMNSYFASVEQQDNPVWRGLPLGVCEHLGGIIIAASIEAKKWGIKTGTPVWEARKLYPKIIITPTRPDAYRLYNRRMVKVVSDYANYVERYSIDEVFIDITASCNIKFPISNFQFPNNLQCQNSKNSIQKFIMANRIDWLKADPFAEAVRVAREIKRRMKKEVGDYLTCSIGIAENKLLAKIGSDLKKPDGIVVIKNSEFRMQNVECGCGYSTFCIHHFALENSVARVENSNILYFTKADLYHRLKLIDIPGIGRRQEENLNGLGIKTLLDLKNYPKSHLVSRFGPLMGHHLYNMGQLEGSWKVKVEEERGIKSIGHMYTLPKEYRRPEFFAPVLYKLCEMVGQRLRKQKLMGNVIHFFVSTPESNFSKSISAPPGVSGQISEYVSFDSDKIANGVNKNYEGFRQDRRLGFYIYDGRDIFLQTADMHADHLNSNSSV